MAIEIEHKYLVNKKEWQRIKPIEYASIKQGYLLNTPEKTIRVRVKNTKGFITIKGSINHFSRLEYEYEIPYADAIDLLHNHCKECIEKKRYTVLHESKCWEVDEFEGLNEGLIVAEIELKHENETYNTPMWIDLNVTEDSRYTNAVLATHPFTNW
jgi:adenylate cyclase